MTIPSLGSHKRTRRAGAGSRATFLESGRRTKEASCVPKKCPASKQASRREAAACSFCSWNLESTVYMRRATCPCMPAGGCAGRGAGGVYGYYSCRYVSLGALDAFEHRAKNGQQQAQTNTLTHTHTHTHTHSVGLLDHPHLSFTQTTAATRYMSLLGGEWAGW